MIELEQLADAVFNGLCLAAENGLTEAWKVAGVKGPVDDFTFPLQAKLLRVVFEDGREAAILVTL